MVTTTSAKHSLYTMLTISEIEALLEFAKKNQEETRDDRVILVTHKHGLGHNASVANVDQFFDEQKKHPSYSGWDNESIVLFDTKNESFYTDFLKDITDYGSW